MSVIIDGSKGITTFLIEKGFAAAGERLDPEETGGLVTRYIEVYRTRQLKAPIHVFIRPRLGSFVYDAGDLDVMRADIHAVKRAGAPGVVFGALTNEGVIDHAAMADLIAAARPMVVGFHRAFDQIADQSAALETLIELGVAIVLTSGGAAKAIDGAAQLRRLVDHAAGRIEILAGGGVTSENVRALMDASGVTHVHGKAFRGLRGTPIDKPAGHA